MRAEGPKERPTAVPTCHHGHATVLVYVGILLLYIYNHVYVVFNEIA